MEWKWVQNITKLEVVFGIGVMNLIRGLWEKPAKKMLFNALSVCYLVDLDIIKLVIEYF